MFINFCIRSKWKIIVIVLITIIIFAGIITTILLKTDKVINGTKIKFDVTNLDIPRYYAKYDMTIISNKNINTYSVSEWYEKGVQTKLEYYDYMKNTVTILLKDNTCYITNSGNAANLTVNNIANNKNVSSFSTFMYVFNLIDSSCNCKKSSYEKEDKISLMVDVCTLENCKIKEVFKEQKMSKLELVIKDNIPLNYIVYDENKNEYISIVYNIFEINNEK